MASRAVTIELEPKAEELAEAILEALAKVRATPVGELREVLAATGATLRWTLGTQRR